jgi:uncharacterized hydrophobic protein (TIGR00341 family)
MAQRLIELYIPDITPEDADMLLKEKPVIRYWFDDSIDDIFHIRILVKSEDASDVLDFLEKRFSSRKEFQIVILPVEASIPRIEEKTDKDEEKTDAHDTKKKKASKVIREELYEDIVETAKPSAIYIAMVVLSSVVAAIGILRNNPAIVIGAMVIAPLLGPNVALALATTLADVNLARKALLSLGMGIAAAAVISIAWGYMAKVDIHIPGMSARTIVGFGDITLALASGCAGVLSFTSGAAASLVGVMVAVALLPPLVTSGLLFGSGHLTQSLGALLILMTNIICINLSGILTFLVQGVRPLTWWETKKSRKMTGIAITIWVLLFLALLGAIYLSRNVQT